MCPNPEVFTTYDADSDNNLDCSEFNELFTFWANVEIVTPGTCWPDRGEKLCWLFAEIDTDNNGLISEDEFDVWVLAVCNRTTIV